MSGLGGDELFGGYPSFKRMKVINHYLNIKNNLLSDKLSEKNHIPNKLLEKHTILELPDLLYSDNLLDSYIALRGIFSKNESLNITNQILGDKVNEFSEKSFDLHKKC